MKWRLVLVLAVVLFGIANIASADMIQGINIDFVTIGNAGNTADSTGYGAVDYEFSIGKYEVTNAQWNAFTTAVGVPIGNPSNAYSQSAYYTDTQQPTNNVSWYEAAQFCNYLTSGDKSLGAYLFSNTGDFLAIDRDSAMSAYGIAYVIPTEDEWYKAAYYTGSGYSLYANGLNTIPAADNGWNYSGGVYDQPWDVGTGIIEQNGTFDMMGNVWEWNEEIISVTYWGVRGGSFTDADYDLKSSTRDNGEPPWSEQSLVGFRVAAVTPVPSAVILGGLGLTFSGWLLKRKRMI